MASGEVAFVKGCTAVHADCFTWLEQAEADSIHAVVTDPPYGVKEYQSEQIDKRDRGDGGTWRIPPAFDGQQRAPLPRFTALGARERAEVRAFFVAWSGRLVRALRPGAHVFVAGNAFLSQLVYAAVLEGAGGALEFRGELIRLVRTLRGGDRPKGAEQEFPGVASLLRGGYEPWGVFRKALPPRMTVSECLRCYQTGGLRRLADGRPLCDVIESERTPQRERLLAPHPSLKPQSLLRPLVYAALPLGEGLIVDPFMGAGSTLAAAAAQGLRALGVERHRPYYDLSLRAIPALAGLPYPAGATSSE